MTEPHFPLMAGETAGSDAWWAGIARQGTPLVTLTGDGRARVDFLWRDRQGCERTSSIRRVLIDVPSVTDHHGPTPESLRRIAGTDIWRWSVELEADWRGSYCFIPMGGVLSADPADRPRQWLSLLERAESDPLNPLPPHAGILGQPLSAAQLPGAPPQSDWHQAGKADPARLHRLTWDSPLLGNRRPVWIYTTGDGADRPLVLLLDGGYWAEGMPIFAALDHRTAAGPLPAAVYVLIDAIDRDSRNRELPCHAPFWEAVQTELLPRVSACAPFTADPDRTVVAGQSFGGLAALFAGLHWPGRFGRALSQSGSFWWDEAALVRRIEDGGRASAPVTVFLESGSRETAILPANQRMRTALEAAGHTVGLHVFSGGHDPLCWRGGLLDGLSALLKFQE